MSETRVSAPTPNRSTQLLRIAAQIERWARYDDVMAPGLDDAETLRDAADEIVSERDRYREALGKIAAEDNPFDYECQRIAQAALTYRSYFDGSHS